MAKDPLYHSLLEACSQPGCPVCRVVLGLVDRYLNVLFYEGVNDIPTRATLRRSRGFCSSHARRLLGGEVGNALGIAIIYNDVLTNVLRDLPPVDGEEQSGGVAAFFLRAGRQAGSWVKKTLSALSPTGICLACTERDQVSRLAVDILLYSLQEEEFSTALAGSDGLCLLHLRQAVDQSGSEEKAVLLLQTSLPQIEALNADLAEFIRKNDYRFRSEGFGKEGDAWRRAVAKVQGERES
jgi:hypothetical protein